MKQFEELQQAMIDVFRKDYSPEDTQIKRLSICKECEYYIKVTSQCRKCGCLLGLKTRLSNSACPIGKWGAE